MGRILGWARWIGTPCWGGLCIGEELGENGLVDIAFDGVNLVEGEVVGVQPFRGAELSTGGWAEVE